MADECAPTTDEVREGLCISGGILTASREERDARFRRWLAAHDREVAEKAWDEGYDTAIRDEDRGSSINPYRSSSDCGCDLTGMAPPAVHIVDNHEGGAS